MIEVEFVCINPSHPSGTKPENADRLYKALCKLPDILVYREDFFEEAGHWAMCAAANSESQVQQIVRLAEECGVAIDEIHPFDPDVLAFRSNLIDIYSSEHGYEKYPDAQLPPATSRELSLRGLNESAWDGRFYHVTERENAQDIIQNGFEGGWGDVGFGVYLYDNLSEATAYAVHGGWDQGLVDPVILEVSTNEVEKVEPHPDWDADKYANMYWHEMEEDERWSPPVVQI